MASAHRALSSCTSLSPRSSSVAWTPPRTRRPTKSRPRDSELERGLGIRTSMGDNTMGGGSQQLGLMVDLMKHQDTITWTAFEASFAVQAALGTMYAAIRGHQVGRSCTPRGTPCRSLRVAYVEELPIDGLLCAQGLVLGPPSADTLESLQRHKVMAVTHIVHAGAWLLLASGASRFRSARSRHGLRRRRPARFR